MLLFGLLTFGVGFVLSFKLVLLPLIQQTSGLWNRQMRVFVAAENLDNANHLLGGALLIVGFYCTFSGARGVFRRLMETLNPNLKSGAVNQYVRRQQLAQGPKIVAIGGGTGLSTLLRGLKQHSSNITAIVTVTDDGGSSGRLVQEMGIIPPGDIRNCLVALADAEKRMTDLFQHRFATSSGTLSGHSIGNLLIAALIEQSGGDFEKALEAASEVLAIRGRVIPSTLDRVRLRAFMEDGSEVCGETNIVQSLLKVCRVFLDPQHAEPHPEALSAIADADLIVVGPGSVYTSLIPNLLVPRIAESIHQARAVKAFVCNVMTQPGESVAYTAADHVVAVQANVDEKVCDCVLVNTGIPSEVALERYRESGQHLVEADIDRIRTMGLKVVAGDYMSESDVVRHDPLRVARRLMGLLNN